MARTLAQVSLVLVINLVGATGAMAQIDTPLTDQIGDAARGRALVADKRKTFCLLCHSGPFPEERFMGNLAPPLDGAGMRMSAAALRQQIVDPRRHNPATIMPAYDRTDGFQRVAKAFAGRTILNGQEIEDIVAYLQTLKN